MKIAMIGQKGLPASWGGVERQVEGLATRLVEQGQEVTVYCRRWFSAWPLPKYKGVVLRFVPSLRTKHLDAISHTFFATLDALRRDFDIIHYHGVGPALLAWLPRILKPRAKVVVTFHCLDRFHGKWGWLARQILRLGEWGACRFPHETIVISRLLRDYVKEKYHCSARLIPYGVEVRREINQEGLARFSLEPKTYLLAVSRLVSHKNLHYLIEAWRRAKKSRPDLFKGLKLVLVGGSSFTDDYAKKLRAKACLAPEIIFTGWQTGRPLAAWQANALMFVHPSQSEGLSVAVLEAMSYGLPVLASDIPEHQEIIPDRRLLFASGQPADLADKLVWALENPAILKVAGLQNRQAAGDYSWEEVVFQTKSLYWTLTSPESGCLPVFTVKRLKFTAG